jgi:hypothetical protein
MRYTLFPEGVRKLTIELSDKGIKLEQIMGRKKFIAWEQVIGAALDITEPVAVPQDIPHGVLMPGFRWLVRFNDRNLTGTKQLIIAYRQSRIRRRIEHLRIPDPKNSELSREFITELESYIPDRWLGERFKYAQIRKKLGFQNWYIWIFVAVWLVVIFMLWIGYMWWRGGA